MGVYVRQCKRLCELVENLVVFLNFLCIRGMGATCAFVDYESRLTGFLIIGFGI